MQWYSIGLLVRHYCITVLGKLFAPLCCVTRQYNLVPTGRKTRKVMALAQVAHGCEI